MHRRRVYYVLHRLSVVRIWYLIAALVISVALSVIALRQNNIGAIQLRNELLEVDKANGDVESKLRELRQFTYAHMNSSLAVQGGPYPPIQLKYRYERLVAAEKQRVSDANSKLTTEAQQVCERQIPVGRSADRLGCISNYLTTRGAVEQPIRDDLYKFDFADPFWSPDLAGWSLVASGLLSLALIVRYATEGWLRHKLNQ